MRVVHFSTYGPIGGAGKAAHVIHAGLLRAGCDSRMVVARAGGNYDGVTEWPGAKERLALSLEVSAGLHPTSDFNPDSSSNANADEWDLPETPDIVHLHWIAGFLFASDIRLLYERYKAPIVWTMADMHPLTGGCHYSHGCDGFTKSCGHCPIIRSHDENDASRRSWLSKNEKLSGLPIDAVSVSGWSDALAGRSSLFSSRPRTIIPCGIDDSIFRVRRRDGARRLLRLPEDARIVMFGAANHRDERKGIGHMVAALQHLADVAEPGLPLVGLSVGASPDDYRARIPFPVVELGALADDRLMALAYQAADVFVCPSMEDAGPMMIPEALLCGTPVVAFSSAGFAEDLIRAGINGRIALSGDALSLASGIAEVLTRAASGEIGPEECRASALPRYSMGAQASAYIELYRNLLERS